MNTPTNPQQSPALVEIRLSDVVGHGGYDYENDEPVGEVTIADLVVKGLVDKMAKKLQETVEQAVRVQIEEMVKARVGAWVDAELAKPIQKTNMWGKPEGSALSLPELVETQVQAWLTEPMRDRYDNRVNGKTKVQALIAEEVNRKLESEMTAALRTAKAQIVKAVQTKGGELLGEAIRTANLLDGVRS